MDGNSSPEVGGENRNKDQLKTVEYTNNIGKKGKVVYRREGNRIIFSGIHVPDSLSNTVNQAESVVRAIAESEGLDYQNPNFGKEFEFYDLSTPKGFSGRSDPRERMLRREILNVGDVELDRLHIQPTEGGIGFHVQRWEPINMPERSRDIFSLLPPKEQK